MKHHDQQVEELKEENKRYYTTLAILTVVVVLLIGIDAVSAGTYQYQNTIYDCDGSCTKITINAGANKTQCLFLYSLIDHKELNAFKCYPMPVYSQDKTMETGGRYIYNTKKISIYDVDGKNTIEKAYTTYHEHRHHQQNLNNSFDDITAYYKMPYQENSLEIDARRYEVQAFEKNKNTIREWLKENNQKEYEYYMRVYY